MTSNRLLFLFTSFLLCSIAMRGQQHYYLGDTNRPEHQVIDSSTITLDWSGEAFFRNNEYLSNLYTGYTLPGYRLSASVGYSIKALHGAKLSVGLYNLGYFGASRYPGSVAYTDVAYWSDRKHANKVHLLPIVRAEIKPTSKSIFVLGTIYGAAYHQLIAPLYNPELNLTADPEMGVQYRYGNDRFQSDIWVNWQSFIYKIDNHQEAFTGGLSMNYNFMPQEKRFRLSMPLQVVACHRGGEYNLTQNDTVHTWINAALGIQAAYRTNLLGKTDLTASLYGLGYLQRGEHYPSKDGKAYYVTLGAHHKIANLELDYFRGDGYVSPLGLPFANCLNAHREAIDQKKSSYFQIYGDIHYTFKLGLTFGFSTTFWIHPNKPYNGSSSAMEAYMSISPSVILKK